MGPEIELIGKIKVPQSLERAFQKDTYDADGYQKANINYVGVCNFGIAKQKSYTDDKLFPEKARKPLLLQFYEYAILDDEERKSLAYVVLIESKEEYRIKLEKDFFDTLVPTLFLNELSKILRYGLLKAYELREENKQFLRGKINLKEQIKNKIRKQPFIACRYWDLTTDIYLNRLLLKAANILSSNQKVSQALRSKFFSYCNIISQEMVSLVEISPNDLKFKIVIPKRYELAVILAEAIIRRHYHSIIELEEVECPSFMINASAIWESFLRVAVKNALEGWKVGKVKERLTILERSPDIIPDIVAEKSKEEVMIIDIKYKSGALRALDLYQICAYLGTYQQRMENLKGFLLYLYPELDEKEEIYKFYPLGKEMGKHYLIKILYFHNELEEFDVKKFVLTLRERLLK